MRKASVAINIKKGFNDNDARYMCCRNKYHLRTGAIIVGGVELIAIGLTILYCVIAYFMDGFYKPAPSKSDLMSRRRSLLILSLAMSTIAFAIWLIVFGLTVWGIKKARPALLFPHMMTQVLAIVSLAGLSALFIWWVVDANDHKKPNLPTSKTASIGWEPGFRANRDNVFIATIIFSTLASVCVIAFFTEIFFFFVVRRCYQYLRAKINYQQQLQHRRQSQTIKVIS